MVIARVDPECEFDGGQTSGGIVSGVLDRGNRVQRDGFVLHQNHQNPFEGYTVIGFELPEATDARLIIYEVTGKMIKEIKGEFAKGYNEVTIARDENYRPPECCTTNWRRRNLWRRRRWRG